MGKLIAFEGIDGSGKSTHARLAREKLADLGVDFRSVTFPRYDNPSATLIKMYLGGEFGSNPGDVNPYASSCFYAVDRYASFKQDWMDYYNNGGIMIADRYTTSNAIHQGAKFPPEKRNEFFRWLTNFEFDLMELPKPDAVIYMDTPLELAKSRIISRAAGAQTDIHERDFSYLALCHECGSMAADEYGWIRIKAEKDGRERSVDEVNDEIFGIIKEILSI